jgi:hypothetical protein
MSDGILQEGEDRGRGAGHAAQWGLASLLTGGLVVLVAPLTLIVNILLAAFGPGRLGLDAPQITLVTWGFAVGLAVVLLLGVGGMLFGIAGIFSARARGQPVALGLAGVLVSVAGLLLFSIAAIDAVFVLVWFNRDPFR